MTWVAVGGVLVVWKLPQVVQALRYGITPLFAMLIVGIGIACLVAAAKILLSRPAPAPRRGGAPSSDGPAIEHEYLALQLPAGFRAAEAPGELFARFVGPGGVEVEVVLAQLLPPCDPEVALQRLVDAHAGLLRSGATSIESSTAVKRSAGGVLEMRREHLVHGRLGPHRAVARYAVTTGPLALRGSPPVHATVQVRAHAPLGSPVDPGALVDAAVLVPALQKLAAFDGDGPRVLYPYLLHEAAAAQRDAMLASAGRPPEGFGSLPALANGLHLTLAEDSPQALRPLFPVDLTGKGLSLETALPAARALVAEKLGTSELPVRTVRVTPFAIPPVWRDGLHAVVQGTDTVQLVVVGPSWMAASAIMTDALYTYAASALGSTDLLALAPHRDLAFVFANAGESANRLLAEGIARAEADGQKPLSPVPVPLGPQGVEARGAAP